MLLTPIPVFMPATAGWTPASLGSALKGWYKADTGVYKDAGSTLAANNDTVQQWNDQSGNGYNISQATAGNRPTLLTAGFNSHPTIQLSTAGTTYLTSGASGFTPGATTTLSTFAVLTLTSSAASYARIASYVGSGQTNDFDNTSSAALIIRNSSNAELEVFQTDNRASQSISYATHYRFGSIFDGVNVTTYLNNSTTAFAAASGTFASPGRLTVGSAWQGSPSAYWDGLCSEVVITNTALSSTDRNNLDTYFTNKWGT